MSNLHKHQDHHPATRVERAVRAPRMKETGTDRDSIKKIYLKALELAGHRNWNPEDVRVEIDLLREQIQARYTSLTYEELAYLSESGAIGEYGQYHGISPKTFVSWIKSYLSSQERKKAIRVRKEEEARQLEKSKPLSHADKRKTWDEAVEHYNTSQTVIGGKFLFQIGVELGEIDIKDEMTIEEVKYHALNWFKSEKDRLLAEAGLASRVLIRQLKEVIDADDKTRSQFPMWQNRCKHVAVELKFKEKLGL